MGIKSVSSVTSVIARDPTRRNSQSLLESPLIQGIVLAEISRVPQPLAVRAALLMSQRATDLDDSALKQVIFSGGRAAYSIDLEGISEDIGLKNASSQHIKSEYGTGSHLENAPMEALKGAPSANCPVPGGLMITDGDAGQIMTLMTMCIVEHEEDETLAFRRRTFPTKQERGEDALDQKRHGQCRIIPPIAVKEVHGCKVFEGDGSAWDTT